MKFTNGTETLLSLGNNRERSERPVIAAFSGAVLLCGECCTDVPPGWRAIAEKHKVERTVPSIYCHLFNAVIAVLILQTCIKRVRMPYLFYEILNLFFGLLKKIFYCICDFLEVYSETLVNFKPS